MEQSAGPSLLARVLAVVILAVAAWFLLKVVISVVVGVAWIVAVIVAIVGVLWAVNTLRQPMAGGAFLVIALSFGLAGGVIGRIKGSSFFLWFLIAGIPPFIGLLAAIFYRDEHDEPQRVCPGCGKVVPLYQALCTRCGTELEFPEGGELDTAETAPAATR